ARGHALLENGSNQQKARPKTAAGLLVYSRSFIFEVLAWGSAGVRDELRGKILKRLIGLLGKIGVESADFLRLADERLVGGSGIRGLRLDRLIQRFRPGELLGEGSAVFKRLPRVIPEGYGNSLNALLKTARGCDRGVELLFTLLLNVFDLGHDDSLSSSDGMEPPPFSQPL